VSLCRMGVTQQPAGVAPEDRVEVWLIDSDDPALNPNLELVLADAADAVAALRAEGKRVLLHTVAALYAARHRGVGFDEALAAVREVLPDAAPQRALVDAARRVASRGELGRPAT
jgi:ADP-ribosyl-[dinitrogen reductase] hydrolase